MSSRAGLAVCVVLVLAFATLSYSAVLTKSPTFDEPLQALAGWVKLYQHDHRVNFEDPPLWEEWATALNGRDSIKPDFAGPYWTEMPAQPVLQWAFTDQTLFETPGVDGVAFVNRARAMMLVLGVLLGALIAFWAWRLGGPTAAVIATLMFALDPNFLAHASMVKNDVAMSLATLGIAFLTWRMGQRLTWGNAIALVLACAVAANFKFSSILLAPILLILFGVRAFFGEPWTVLKGRLTTRRSRGLAVAALAFATFICIYGAIWVCYGFRYSVAPDPRLHINTAWELDYLRTHQLGAKTDGHFGPEEIAKWTPDPLSQVLLWVLKHHLLPEAWVWGFLFIRAATSWRTSFLFNARKLTGWFYYFPVAMLVKTPVATLLALAAAFCLGIWFLRRRARSFGEWWTVVCLAIPPGVYLLSSMLSNMNIGVRHVLPIYGFMYVGCGVVGSAAIRRWGRQATLAITGLVLGVAVETLSAAPDFIAFFNVAAGGERNGINLLADSNLDWGQDLPLLAQWQKQHPEINLYLSYFGMTDPAAYGIRYRPLIGNYKMGPKPDGKPLHFPAVFAISASNLQALPKDTEQWAGYRNLKPRDVLGGTIYLYDIPSDAAKAQLGQ